jgi:hypothetical protein
VDLAAFGLGLVWVLAAQLGACAHEGYGLVELCGDAVEDRGVALAGDDGLDGCVAHAGASLGVRVDRRPDLCLGHLLGPAVCCICHVSLVSSSSSLWTPFYRLP